MPFQVKFAKNGFYHAAFGRLGRGQRNGGKIYTMPDWLRETEEVKVPVRDPVTQKGTGKEKVITRFKHMPTSAQIIEKVDLEEVLEEAEQEKPIKAKVIDEAEYEKALAQSVPKEAEPEATPVAQAGSRRKPIK